MHSLLQSARALHDLGETYGALLDALMHAKGHMIKRKVSNVTESNQSDASVRANGQDRDRTIESAKTQPRLRW